ncbi:MAG: GGDEF domain-containing protein, partial [Campylobacteraceae bacterium]|nr:GGDEF domain-containing protein [Campylobacteraceae bacterium]
FEFMQQDITILPYNIEKKQITILVYDQTTLMEEKMKCYKESDALAKAMKIANATIKKLESAKNKLVKQQDIIYKQAHYDHLTSLANRSLLHQRLEVLIQESSENNKKFAILFLDLDRFKEINDSLGHDVGDELLVRVAKILLQATRKTDTVARIGGDEFVILLDDVGNEKTITSIAQKLLQALDQPLKIKEYNLHVTTSIGISIYPDHGNDFNALLKNADVALYEAKAAGRNNFKIFS